MKHLLTAALIASALASPVRGEIVQLTCASLQDDRADLRLDIEMNDFSASAGSERSLDLLSSSDNHISWTYEDHDWAGEGDYFVAAYVLNRTTLVLTLNFIAPGDYEFFERTGLYMRPSFYQCTRPL